jgi:hypothetical protein
MSLLVVSLSVFFVPISLTGGPPRLYPQAIPSLEASTLAPAYSEAPGTPANADPLG